jgi:hypothetical protein
MLNGVRRLRRRMDDGDRLAAPLGGTALLKG